MRLLARLFGLSRSPRAPAAPARDERMRKWQHEVQQLCAQRMLAEAEQALKKCPLIESPEEAQQVVRQVVAPILQLCDAANDVQRALAVERWTYANLIRVYEQGPHYDACFQAMERPLYNLGARAAIGKSLGEPPRRRRMLFYVHNVSANLAHMQLLCELIEAYLEACPQDVGDIGIIGWEGPAGVCEPLVRLRERGVYLHEVPLQESLAAVFPAAAADLAGRDGFDQLIFVSLPVGLAFACGRLGPSRVGWLSMKFELAAFEPLQHRYSFTSGLRKHHRVGRAQWWSAAPLMNRPAPLKRSDAGPPEVVRAARRFGTVLYTVNREEKIRDPAYLEAVCDLLERFPDTSFVWTGHKQPPEILDVFGRRGMTHRQFFAGWVHPDDLLDTCDIFLDTPHLSGTVAARAMFLGKPVVSWARAHAWINFFGEAIASDARHGVHPEMSQAIDSLAAQGLSLECEDAQAFVREAAVLIAQPALRESYGRLLRDIAQHYFLDHQRAAKDHFANFRGEALP